MRLSVFKFSEILGNGGEGKVERSLRRRDPCKGVISSLSADAVLEVLLVAD